MSEFTVQKTGPTSAEVRLQPANSEAHIIRVYRQPDGHANISWPMLQGVDARTARLYAEALMTASRIAEEMNLPCPKCGGAMEIHRKDLVRTQEVVAGHVYRCADCGSIVG